MRLTLVLPAIGRKPGVNYMRTWQMEPLSIAVLAALTPKDVDIAFHDDSMEPIPFDRPTDLIAIPVETYTAKRAYQIASDRSHQGRSAPTASFRKRNHVWSWPSQRAVGA